MSTLRTIPDTRKGRLFRRLLWVVGIASIVGIADQLRALFWLVLTGLPPGAGSVAEHASRLVILLAGWVLLCWCAVRGIRRNAVPPAWVVLSIPVLIWAQILVPTLYR